MTPPERHEDDDRRRSWREGPQGGLASQSPDDFHVPYMREPGAGRWRDSEQGPEASPDDFEVGDEESSAGSSAGGSSFDDERPRRRDSGRRRDPYDYSMTGPYSTPPPYETGGPDYLGREDSPVRGDEWHVGRGPKGYRRPPERIREDVCERLTFSPYLDASGVEVEVDENGVVHLAGHVDSRRTKRITEDICDTVFGVSDVKNELSIDGSTSH